MSNLSTVNTQAIVAEGGNQGLVDVYVRTENTNDDALEYRQNEDMMASTSGDKSLSDDEQKIQESVAFSNERYTEIDSKSNRMSRRPLSSTYSSDNDNDEVDTPCPVEDEIYSDGSNVDVFRFNVHGTTDGDVLETVHWRPLDADEYVMEEGVEPIPERKAALRDGNKKQLRNQPKDQITPRDNDFGKMDTAPILTHIEEDIQENAECDFSSGAVEGPAASDQSAGGNNSHRSKSKRKKHRSKSRRSRRSSVRCVSVSCQTDISITEGEELITKKAENEKSVPTESERQEIQPVEDKELIDKPSSLENVRSSEIFDPILVPGVSSEQSFDTESYTTSSDDDDTISVSSSSFLPSIGPPNIVKYQRETEEGLNATETVDARIKREAAAKQKLQKTMFSGPCQYCKQQIMPLPTGEELSSLPINKLFCCEEYENFIRLHLSIEKGTFSVNDEIIDIAPSEHFGTKAARKAAKERAAQRLREREIEKQRVAAAQANFFSYTRQMKTIQYTLSSPKCMNEGWTIKTNSPIPEQEEQVEIEFEVDVNTTSLQKAKSFYQRFYENGKTFLTIFADGSGCCYYPSGNVAVLITTYEEGKYSYFAFKNKSDPELNDPGILAVFEPNGNGCSYFGDGTIRLVLNALGGMQSDKQGKKLKKWLWNPNNWHQHTPPLQPLCLALNKHISLRLKNQDDIVLTFTCAYRSVRFNVGAKLKPVKPIRMKSTGKDEHDIILRNFKQNIGTLFSKIEMTLKFPNCPRLNKLSLPPHLGARRRSQRNDSRLPSITGSESAVIVN